MTQFFKTSDAIAELQKEFPSITVQWLYQGKKFWKHGIHYIDVAHPPHKRSAYEWNVAAIAAYRKTNPELRLSQKSR